jgi:hypothetical protein
MAVASQELLESLHANTAQAFSDMIRDGVKVVVGEGEDAHEVQLPLPPAMWNVITKFIKDNDITGAIEGVKKSLIETDPELSDELPFKPKLVSSK